MKPDPLTPSEEVKAVRLSLNLTQAQLAHAIGVTTNTVWTWEHGRRGVDAPTIQLLRRFHRDGKATTLPQPKGLLPYLDGDTARR